MGTPWHLLRAELGVDPAHPAYESARIAFDLGAEARTLREQRGWSQVELRCPGVRWLDARPLIEFVRVAGAQGRDILVPTRLPQIPPRQALATIELPLAVNWSQPGRLYRLSERGDRARVYEMVLREGAEDDILRYIDGTLLVDLWDELVLPQAVRAAWAPLIQLARE